MRYIITFIVLLTGFCPLSSCDTFTCEMDMPGNISNPKLVSIINEKMDKQLEYIEDPAFSSASLPGSAAHARKWLEEIDHVITHCSCKGGNEKGNKLTYDVILKNGQRIENIYTGKRCLYLGDPPTVLRVNFTNGRVSDVTTDGREKKNPVSFVTADVLLFVKIVLRVDQERNPTYYYPPVKTEADHAKEWEEK